MCMYVLLCALRNVVVPRICSMDYYERLLDYERTTQVDYECIINLPHEWFFRNNNDNNNSSSNSKKVVVCNAIQ